jgi:aldehyde:ferredoxin oxidoreductase
MNFMKHFYNMKLGIVDLAESSVETVPLDAEIISEKIGGAAVNMELFENYGDADSLILGVGPLTGSYAPASCLLVATFRSRVTGSLSHVPFMHRSGPEMKFSGFDFMVIKQAASRPTVLNITEGTVTFLPADHMVKCEVPEIIRSIKQKVHHVQAAIVTGPAANNGLPFASASAGLWGSLDKTGLASVLGTKNVKGLVFNGIDGLPFGADNLAKSDKMIKTRGLYGPSQENGFISVLEKLGADDDVKTMLYKSRAKNIACYRCPFPCMNHIEFEEKASEHMSGNLSHRGLNLMDHVGFLILARKYKGEVFELMSSCLRLGVDPVVVSAMLPDGGTMDDRLEMIKVMSAGAVEGGLKGEEQEGYPTFGGIPPEKHKLFGGGLAPIFTQGTEDPVSAWENRVALSLVLGVCPVFLSLFPAIKEADLISFFVPEKGALKIFQARVNSSTRLLCGH